MKKVIGYLNVFWTMGSFVSFKTDPCRNQLVAPDIGKLEFSPKSTFRFYYVHYTVI